MGGVIPLRVKTDPLTVACEIETLEPPEFVSVPDNDCVPPTVTVPKARLVGFAAIVPALAPVPDNGMERVGLGAFEVITTLPLAGPETVGANVTVKVALCPAFKVRGAAMPLRVKPDPLTAACEIETLEPPEFVSVPDNDCVPPTVTVPKAKLDGFAAIAPAVIAFPDNEIVSVGFDALEDMVTLPLADPETVGANFTVKVALCPALNVTGAVMPLSVNPDPLMAACEIVTLDAPEFVNVSDSDCVLPTVTVPNARLVGFAVMLPAVAPVPEIGMVKVGFAAFEVIVRLPLAETDAVGANFTVNVALCPAFNVRGAVRPLRVKPDPLTVA
jgi:hypothetical protein